MHTIIIDISLMYIIINNFSKVKLIQWYLGIYTTYIYFIGCTFLAQFLTQKNVKDSLCWIKREGGLNKKGW